MRGPVVDRESGEPVTAFRVRLRGGGSMEQWKPGLSFTSADGRFTATARPHEILELSSINWEDFQILPGLEGTLTGDGGAFRFLEEKPAAIILKERKHRRRVILPEERAGFRGPDGRLRIPLEPGERLGGVCYRDGRPW